MMFDSEEISRLKGNELIKIDKTVKKDANLSIVSFQFLKLKVTFL